jgi:hypothetical protein
MLKIDWEKELQQNKEKITTDSLIYPIIEREKGCNYYKICGLKLYMTCKTEGVKRDYAQKIVDYANNLEDGVFSLEYAEFQNPKLENGKFFASVCYDMIPAPKED